MIGTGINDLHVIWGMADVMADRVIWGTDTDNVDMTSTAINGEQ